MISNVVITSTLKHAIMLLALCVFSCRSFSIELPSSLQVILISKLLVHEEQFGQKKKLSVYVINNEEIYQAFNKLNDVNTNNGVYFSEIGSGKELPQKHYDLVYLNETKLLPKAKDYVRRHRTALITGLPELVKQGITLGTGTIDGKPKFYLNITTSNQAGLSWQPKILSFVDIFK